MNSSNLYTPGQDNAPAGTYQEVGPRGGKAENSRTVRISRGDRLPLSLIHISEPTRPY